MIPTIKIDSFGSTIKKEVGTDGLQEGQAQVDWATKEDVALLTHVGRICLYFVAGCLGYHFQKKSAGLIAD
jgi:hypothetical protein